MPTEGSDLGSLQRWLLRAITDPDGAGEASKAAREILPRPGLSANARLGLYADMVRRRLTGVLCRDFPLVERTLGALAFRDIARGYLVAHPSQSYRLSDLGAELPAFLARAERVPSRLRAFIADLARLERAVDEAHDAAGSATLDVAALRSVPAEQWTSARFRTVPALRLLALDYPVNGFFESGLARRSEVIPGRGLIWLAVWRRGREVWRAEIDPWQHAILAALRDGRTLGDALVACLDIPGVDPETLQQKLGDWFTEWTADGLFARVEID